MPRKRLDVLYCDNHLLAVRKPAGVLVQPDKTGDVSLLDLAKEYVKARFDKKGNVFVGCVHRLDRPVSGVVVFARTSKAAARLSEQFRGKQVEKIYWAIVEGKCPLKGVLEDQLLRSGQRSRVVEGAGGKEASLGYRRIALLPQNRSAVEISLHSGRHHQIRVQFASLGHPVVGDLRYGSTQTFPNRAIALHAHALSIEHPTTKEKLTFRCGIDRSWPDVFTASARRAR
jgi:23S rRNA pseudouridine1911/1915/1917 synthase